MTTEELPLIKLSDIKIVGGKRIREKMEDIDALAASIKHDGLLFPIVVDKDYQLIDGMRRISAYKQLGLEQIPTYVHPTIKYSLAAELVANTQLKPLDRDEMDDLKAAIVKDTVGIDTSTGKIMSDQKNRIKNLVEEKEILQRRLNQSKLREMALRQDDSADDMEE